MENRLFDLFYRCNQKVSTDSRKIEQGCLYIALKGDNFDGNKFARQALDEGAKYAIVDNKDFANGSDIFHVSDGLIFLQDLANYHRNKFSIPVIGITGSNGKTTSKELIASVLKQKFNILYTLGNLNNHIGVPLTLLRLNNDHDIAIIEMGANKPGDIAELCAITNPTHGIITNIGAAHLEGFGSFEGVIKTKSELYTSIKKIGGTLFYNEDDEILKNVIPSHIETISYSGKNNTKATINGELIAMDPFVNFTWKDKLYTSPTLTTQIIGQYNFYNFLAAIAIGQYFEIEPELINKGILSYAPDNNRSQIIKSDKNTIIMDAYNANPTSVKSALQSFDLIEEENKLFILGDMFELGDDSLSLHAEIVELVNKLELQGIFIGHIYQQLSDKYEKNLFFKTKEEAIAFLNTAQPHHNLILIKGSRGMKLEELQEYI
jgi:UDP-N-acetylmuramoyl-tripeptide--D-alanyl-D-alanine ligase